MATRLKVTYVDGREEEVLASPKAQVRTERFLGGITEQRQVEGSFYLAWASLNQAGKESAQFEDWLDNIADVAEVEAPKVDPTPADPSSTSSSDSAPSQESPTSTS